MKKIDASWLTRGYFSQNATQNYALLYYKHMSQRGTKEEQNEFYMGTSKSAESVGLTELFGEAFKEGMEISTHVQAFDSSSLLSLRKYFPDESKTSVIMCAGHCDRAQQKWLKIKEVLCKVYSIL